MQASLLRSTVVLYAVIAALIWVVISVVTGSGAVVVVVGGLACAVVAFIIGYAFRHRRLHRRS